MNGRVGDEFFAVQGRASSGVLRECAATGASRPACRTSAPAGRRGCQEICRAAARGNGSPQAELQPDRLGLSPRILVVRVSR